MKKLFLNLLITCGLFYSCKKEELPKNNDLGSPVFYLRATVNGLPVKIEAGVNDYKMLASNYLDENNVYVFTGELKQVSCTSNCDMSVSILINDFKFSDLNGSIDINNAIKSGNYGFKGADINPSTNVNFTPESADNGGPYNWISSHAGGDSAVSSVYNATRILKNGKNYLVNFGITNPDGSSSKFEQEYKVGNPLQTNISMFFDSGTTYKFIANSTGKAPFSYNWDFGDGTNSTESQPKHSFSLGADQIVKLIVSDSEGNTCISKYLVPAKGKPNPNFSAAFTPYLNARLLSAITIKFTDQSGVVYTSSDLNQPVGSKFEIVSVEDYKTNDKNELTKKVKIGFNCSFTGSSGPLNITNGEAVIAVSYK